jgi:thioredoxin-dependent peroxiredoxin
MNERSGLVTLRGNPVTLVGTEIRVGDKAPDFEVVGNDLKPVSFSSYLGKVCIISSVPSLDTPICEASTKRFNEEAAGLGADVAILTVSMDLPFAQRRWCLANAVKEVETLSDHKDASFGTSYGLLMKEVRLLARAVLVVDRSGTVRYLELVKEIGDEPDYEAALEAAKNIL